MSHLERRNKEKERELEARESGIEREKKSLELQRQELAKKERENNLIYESLQEMTTDFQRKSGEYWEEERRIKSAEKESLKKRLNQFQEFIENSFEKRAVIDTMMQYQ